MSFFIKEENVRAGNRGGRSLFNWNDIRLLNNKERESYLGVTQSIGFLDKGGKWRKRDWWQNKKNQNNEAENCEIMSEKGRIKFEEERLYNDTFNTMFGNNQNQKIVHNNNKKKEKLTVYEWNELMKKEANLNPNDPKIFEFYENDEHKRGLGMKPNISFRTNPYEKETLQGLKKLEGEGLDEDKEKQENEKIKKIQIRDQLKSNNEIENNITVNDREKSKKSNLNNLTLPELLEIWNKGEKDKKKLASFVLGESYDDSKNKKQKKKKSKKSKKSKKKSSNRRSRSSSSDSSSSGKRSRSNNKSRSRSRDLSKSNKRYKN